MKARQMIAEITRRDVAGDDDALLHDLDGWDSLKGVRLVLTLEQKIGRRLSESELERLQSIKDVEVLLRRGA